MVKGKIWFDFCPGYPGQPEIESSHYTEQSPGYGHPYLPGDLKTMKHKIYKYMQHACSFADTNIDVDHFLWTGDIASDEVPQYELSEESLEAGDGFSLVTQKIYPSLPVIRPSSVLVTK